MIQKFLYSHLPSSASLATLRLSNFSHTEDLASIDRFELMNSWGDFQSPFVRTNLEISPDIFKTNNYITEAKTQESVDVPEFQQAGFTPSIGTSIVLGLALIASASYNLFQYFKNSEISEKLLNANLGDRRSVSFSAQERIRNEIQGLNDEVREAKNFSYYIVELSQFLPFAKNRIELIQEPISSDLGLELGRIYQVLNDLYLEQFKYTEIIDDMPQRLRQWVSQLISFRADTYRKIVSHITQIEETHQSHVDLLDRGQMNPDQMRFATASLLSVLESYRDVWSVHDAAQPTDLAVLVGLIDRLSSESYRAQVSAQMMRYSERGVVLEWIENLQDELDRACKVDNTKVCISVSQEMTDRMNPQKMLRISDRKDLELANIKSIGGHKIVLEGNDKSILNLTIDIKKSSFLINGENDIIMVHEARNPSGETVLIRFNLRWRTTTLAGFRRY